MKTITLAVTNSEYEAYRQLAVREGRPMDQVIREAMAAYRAQHLEQRPPLLDLPVLVGHRLVGALPSRVEIWYEIADRHPLPRV